MQFRPLCTPDLSVKGNASEGEAHPIRCKRWACPVCAEINRAKVISIAGRSKPRALLTLTVNANDYQTPEAAALALKNGLRALRLRLSRHPRFERFEFLAVFERHKSGYPHLHLLIKGGFLPWRWLRSQWEDLTGAYMVDIQKIKARKQAAAYVAKYIGKDLAAFPGCKRWWRSHHYSDDADPIERKPERYGAPERYLADRTKLRWAMTIEGFEVERIGKDGIRWRGPPGYPLPLSGLIALAEGRTSASLLRRARIRGATA